MKHNNKLVALVSAMIAAPLVWATCYVMPSDTCRTDLPPTYPKCIARIYNVHTRNYCDSRDGACGATLCASGYNVVTYMEYVYYAIDGQCVLPIISQGGPYYDGTCEWAFLSGDICGYCGY
jgi:hypothetical protein